MCCAQSEYQMLLPHGQIKPLYGNPTSEVSDDVVDGADLFPVHPRDRGDLSARFFSLLLWMNPGPGRFIALLSFGSPKPLNVHGTVTLSEGGNLSC